MLDLLIVTGASKGIGASIVKKCATICKNMIVVASSDKINSINVEGCNIIKLQLDLSDHNNTLISIKNEISKIENVNNLGIILCAAQIGEYGGLFISDLNEWDKLYKCNVLGNLAVVKACSELIQSNVQTKIAFFGGGGAASGYPDFFGYALTKTAIVRAVENLSMEFDKFGYNASVIAVAPGAVATDMLNKVIAVGGEIKTKTDISEPTNFIFDFLNDKMPTKKLNGKFLHVRDDIKSINFSNTDILKLRRIQ